VLGLGDMRQAYGPALTVRTGAGATAVVRYDPSR
jgi:hypothetical protein